MNQLALIFDDAPAIPDAITNELGVMIGNVMRRCYTGTRKMFGKHDSVEIEVGHINGRWAAGRSLLIGSSYCGCAPSFKWGEFESMDDAINENIDDIVEMLNGRIASQSADDREKAGARELLDLVMRNKFSEEMRRDFS